jgi:hypothetical protein
LNTGAPHGHHPWRWSPRLRVDLQRARSSQCASEHRPAVPRARLSRPAVIAHLEPQEGLLL